MPTKFLFLVVVFVLASSPVLAQSLVDVEDVGLDKETLLTICPMGDFPHSYCNKESVTAKLKTVTRGALEGAEFCYITSAGQIVGTGSEVLWNLSDVGPGTYSVTVGIGFGGVIRGKILTKTVKLLGCPACDPPCVCPSLELIGPSAKVNSGDLFIVQLKASGGDERDQRSYRWTANGGTIVGGEKGLSVIVKAPKESAGKSIQLTVDLEGFYRGCGCESKKTIGISVSKE